MIQLNSIKQRFGIIGRSEGLDRALSTAVRVASTDLSVMIQGESGVGKEIFSRIIHELSKRKHNKFIAINCGAIPEGTINSELFGHEKGSFTGATGERKGYFETVDGGTIFLDEIGEMPLDTQAYLLRILESGEFIKVGSSKVLKTDVRIVAATNISLEKQIKKGKFREDLYYRLNTVPIFVPPLRERREDIYMLFRKFAIDFAEKYRTEPIQLDENARRVIENYHWPGNIRELRNAVEQLSVLAEEKLVNAEVLSNWVPHIFKRNLPSIAYPSKEEPNGFHEREILYKFLVDMRTDLQDLKSLIYDLVRKNDLELPEMHQLKTLAPLAPVFESERVSSRDFKDEVYTPQKGAEKLEYNKPIIIDPAYKEEFDNTEEVDETLSIEDMEKDLIQKALKKYNSKRKDAAKELGISERTLYRKIKQYDIND